MNRVVMVAAFMSLLLIGCSANQTDVPKTKDINSAEAQQNETGVVDFNVQIEELQQKVEKAVAKAGNLEGVDRQVGIDMLMELEGLSDEVDLLEDEIEWEAKNGQMSTYREVLKQVGQLENNLDRAENQVELQFGLDD